MPRRSAPYYDPSRNQWILRHKNRRHYLCSGSGEYVKAMALASEIMGATPLGKRPETAGSLAAAWVATFQPKPWARYTLQGWLEAESATPLVSIDRDYLNRLHQRLRTIDNGPKTIRHKMFAVSRVLKWGHSRGYLSILPEMPKLERALRKPRDYTAAELKAIFDALPSGAGSILRFILETGCRPSEACRLQWSDVHLAEGYCVLEEHKIVSRTGEPRIIPLNADARRILSESPRREGYVFLSRMKRPFKPGGLRSTLRRCTKGRFSSTYSFRHTRAQSILDQGGDMVDVAAVLGNSPESAAIYAKVRASRGLAVVESLPSPMLRKTPSRSTPPTSAVPKRGRATSKPSQRRSEKARSRSA